MLKNPKPFLNKARTNSVNQTLRGRDWLDYWSIKLTLYAQSF